MTVHKLAAVLLLVLLAAATACSTDSADEATSEGQAPSSDGQRLDEPGEAEDASADAVDESGEIEGFGGDAESPGLPDTDPLPVSGTGERVIKDGTVTVEVAADGFDAAYRRVVDLAGRFGGGVVASRSNTDEEGRVSGSVTVRVPVEEYERLLVGVTEVGEVVSREVTAQDVTAEFTDLESRLRHLEAQERFYLGLLEEAEGVADAVTVQQQLAQIQQQVEQIKGRLQVLEERTTFSTLTVELFEEGSTGASFDPRPQRPTFSAWWERALDALTNVVGGTLVVVFFLGPLLVPAAVAWAVWRVLRRTRRGARPPTVDEPVDGTRAGV